MKFNFTKYLLLIISLFIFSACGGGNSSSASYPVTGKFVDDPVVGLTYSCNSGNFFKTNTNGEYTCQIWEKVTFRLGDTIIGSVIAKNEIITPYSLFPNNSVAALNLARLLQSLDNKSTDGVLTLDESLLAKLPRTIDFTSDSFVQDVQSVLGVPLVSLEEAKMAMDEGIILLGGDVPQVPIISNFTTSIDENIIAGTTIGALNIIDAGDTAISTISLSGEDSTYFSVSPTGIIKIANGAVLDFEKKSSFNLSAVATNNAGDSNVVSISISLHDIAETALLSNSAGSVAENSAAGTSVGSVVIAKNGDSAITSFTLNGEGSSNFTVDKNGAIGVANGASLDYETKSSYVLTILATNSAGNSNSVNLNITITDVKEAPILANSSGSVNENSLSGTVVGQMSIIDVGGSAIDSFTLSGSSHFTITPSGEITVANGALLNFEEQFSYTLTVFASNKSGNSNSVNLSITIGNVLETPTLANASGSVAENSAGGTSVGSVTITDSGDSAITSFTLSGDGSSKFIVDNSGAITVASGASLDYESVSSYTLNVIATNSVGNSKSTNLNITLLNIAELPILAASTGSVAENSVGGTSVGSVTITDNGDGTISSFTLSGDGSSKFVVDSSGAITVASGANLDYETKSSYALTVFATNSAGNSNSVNLNITITDVNEATTPTLANSTMSVIENAASGTSVGSVTIVSDGGATITNISLSGTGSSNFLVTTSGAVTLSSNSLLDYETTKIYNLTAQATNSEGSSNSVSVTINITDYTNVFQTDKFQGNNTISNDSYGSFLAVEGEYIAVGSIYEDTNATNAGSTYVFKRNSNGSLSQIAQLQSDDIQANDEFGYSVSMSGQYIAIGAHNEDTNGSNAGSAYLFKRNSDTSITQIAKIQSDDVQTGDEFSYSLAISGDYIIAGAHSEDTNGTSAGSAYLFKRNSDTSVTQIAKLQSNDIQAGDEFGWSVDIDGDYIIIGADVEDTNGTDAGSTYLFKRDSDANVTQIAKLQSNDIEAGDDFGRSVAISGDYIIVGADQEDTNGSNAGSAYLFKRNSDTSVTQIAKIQSNDVQADDKFGWAVAINGDFITIGAAGEDTNGTDSGSAYLFRKYSDTNITQISKMQSQDIATSDNFGDFLAMNGNYIIVGAYAEDTGGNSAGSAYLFDIEAIDRPYIYNNKTDITHNEEFQNSSIYSFDANSPTAGTITYSLTGSNSSNFSFTDNNISFVSTLSDGNPADYEVPQTPSTDSNYSLTITLTDSANNTNSYTTNIAIIDKYYLEQANFVGNDSALEDQFGSKVATDGNYTIIGAPMESTTASNSGAAYLYKKQTDGSQLQIAKLKAGSTDSNTNDNFGDSVAISGNYMIIGASGDENASATSVGAAYLFRRNSDTTDDVTLVKKLVGSASTGQDSYGTVAIDGEYIVVGSQSTYTDGVAYSGKAYVYKKSSDDTNISEIAILKAPTVTNTGYFGQAVGINNNFIVIGSKKDGSGTTKGEAYLFDINTTDNSVTRKAIIPSPTGISSNFGASVSISGDYIAIGADNSDTNGSAFVFRKDDPTSVMATLHPSDVSSNAQFGNAVSIDNNMLIVGASSDDSKEINAGSAYVYKINVSTIFKVEKMYASDTTRDFNFGKSVSISGDNLSIGMKFNDTSSSYPALTHKGRVYTYEKDSNQP